MNYETYFKDLFQSIPDYRKIVLSKFLNKKDPDLLKECGFSKNGMSRVNEEFKIILMAEIEECLDHIENREESIIGRFLDK